jgi:hypothetical protein
MLQGALYRAAPSQEAIPPGECYTAALACMAEAVSAHKPALISAALRYLASSAPVARSALQRKQWLRAVMTPS